MPASYGKPPIACEQGHILDQRLDIYSVERIKAGVETTVGDIDGLEKVVRFRRGLMPYLCDVIEQPHHKERRILIML